MEQTLNLKSKFFSWRTIFSFGIAFGVIYFLLTSIDPGEVWAALKSVNYHWYLVAIVVYYAAFPVRAIRFKVMLSNNGIDAGAGALNRILLISWFANCVVPAKMGDLFRGYLVREKYGLSFMKTIGVIFVERVFDLLVLYVVIGVTGFFSFRGRIPEGIMYVMEAGFVIVLALIVISILIKGYGQRLRKWLPHKFEALYDRFLTGTVSSMRDYGKLAFLTLTIWLLEGLSFYFVVKAMHLSLPIVTVLFIALLSALMTALPVTPAGLGLVEAAKVGVLMLFGQPYDISVSAALLDRFINYWSLILVGLVLYLTSAVKFEGGGVINESHGRDSHV